MNSKRFEKTPEEEQEWQDWLASKPANVRAVAEKLDPVHLYRLLPGTTRVCITSFNEEMDGSVTLQVYVSATYNLLMFEREVFGVKPEMLVPCQIPPPTEPVGKLLSTKEEVHAYIDMIKNVEESRSELTAEEICEWLSAYRRDHPTGT